MTAQAEAPPSATRDLRRRRRPSKNTLRGSSRRAHRPTRARRAREVLRARASVTTHIGSYIPISSPQCLHSSLSIRRRYARAGQCHRGKLRDVAAGNYARRGSRCRCDARPCRNERHRAPAGVLGTAWRSPALRRGAITRQSERLPGVCTEAPSSPPPQAPQA